MKKTVALTVVVLLLGIFAAAALAGEGPIKLIVNDKIISPDVTPQIINDRVMVPVRWVAEALGATVEWDEENRTVSIEAAQYGTLQQQVDLYQQALAAATPREAAERWSQGVAQRNGALQYAMLSPELKQSHHDYYDSFGWVTGTSSPWVDSYEISSGTEIDGGKWEFQVTFNLATSTGPAGTTINRVIVRPYSVQNTLPSRDDHSTWYIAQIVNDQHLTAQIQNQARKYLVNKYEQHYQLENIDITLLQQKITGQQAEAEYLTTVTTLPLYKTPEEWPVQKGRLKYLEENRDRLTPTQVQTIEDFIASWNGELSAYSRESSESNEFIKVTASFDGLGLIIPDTVAFYYEDPLGEYQPVIEEEWSSFATAEELMQQGYEEMRRLAEGTGSV